MVVITRDNVKIAEFRDRWEAVLFARTWEEEHEENGKLILYDTESRTFSENW